MKYKLNNETLLKSIIYDLANKIYFLQLFNNIRKLLIISVM